MVAISTFLLWWCLLSRRYELKVKEIHMLDWYGGMHIIPAADYFAAQLLPAAHASVSQQQQKQKQLKQSRMVLLRAARQLL